MASTPARFAAIALALAAASIGLPSTSLAQPPTSQLAAAPTDPATKADRLIAAGLHYLEEHQNADGSWGEAGGPPAITALALRSFALNGDAKQPFVRKGYERLLSFQVQDGGIYKDLLANYNTAIAVTALAAANEPEYRPAIDRAVAYLKGLQWTPETRPEYAGKATDKVKEENQGKQVVADDKDPFFGGWGYGGRSKAPGRPDLSNAQLALDALHDAGVPQNDPAYQRAVAFLTRLQNRSESNDQAWAGDDGGFVYSPAGDRKGETNAGEYTDAAGNRRLRSYGSMTYAGFKSMIYAGLAKDDPRVKAAFAWITANWTLDENPGMKALGPDSAKAGLYYYFHTMGRALSAYGEPKVAGVDWRVALIDKLGSLQNADGSWAGEKRWMEGNPILVTAYAVQALQDARDDLKNTRR